MYQAPAVKGQPPASAPADSLELAAPWEHHERLRPAQLLLLYNANLPESQELAEYYAEQRNVPETHLLGLNAPWPSEELSAARFERDIRQPIREYLKEHRLQYAVRCLVTFYGLPIRIQDVKLSPEQQERHLELNGLLIDKLDALEREVHELRYVAQGNGPSLPARRPTAEDFQKLVGRYLEIRQARWERVQEATDEEDENEAGIAKRIYDHVRKIEGPGGVLSLAQTADPAQADQLQSMAARVLKIRQQAQEILDKGRDAPDRKDAYDLIEKSDGLVGAIRAIDADLALLKTEDTKAAVDNELMLLWWEDYPRFKFLPNPMCWRIQRQPRLLMQIPPAHWRSPVLMTARIDGPTFEIARRIIDDALAAEAAGLEGRVYLDARGLTRDEGLGKYDQNLRDLATMLRARTDLDVHLDNRAEVLAPGQCSEAMLYCGWYSLRKFVDACEFKTGAFAWHIASFEAISLKRPGERGWVKNLLEAGACATIGPVAEPYLQSFPYPRDFFGLLLTGDYTLAECFAYSAHFTSWMQMLIGDPLYRPFARNPHLRIEDTFPEMVPVGANAE